ncbi:ras guanine nucleotide exchange factor domain-containing protein [Desarmillaria tabescens]|uniref:Ras guanine nucleotide exchange factor domain-containing protein n=1 Tax=Armillaria tabescens TaxID=1929756 RepID=A0AA39T4M3_ARMTA|nr:ras guanine nucleotide exchange factor domain-containing protein [Desarmillaria tabescens]KAK0464381.1 ras guanine nucleotide exchange factor domain-containing protein [Desarmillaria tabescens]
MATLQISKPKKLKKITDRKIHIPTAGPVASLPSPPDSSLFSKEPASPTPSFSAPPPLITNVPKCLQRYPSIAQVIARLWETSETTQSIGDFEAYAVTFCNCLSTNILYSLERTPHLDTNDSTYLTTYYNVVDSAEYFRSWACKKIQEEEGELIIGMRLATSMLWFNATLKALKELHKIVDRMVANAKPLPSLPVDSVDLSGEAVVAKVVGGSLEPHKLRSPKLRISPLSVIVEEVLNDDEPSSPTTPNETVASDSTSSLGHFPSADEPSSSTETLPSNQAGFSARRKKLAQQIRHVLKLATERGHRMVRSQASTSTLTSESTTPDFSNPIDRHQAIKTHAIRQSAIYHFEDPSNRVEMPMPEDYAAIRVDFRGELSSATLQALILQITSREGTQESILDTFFFGFRYFTTPAILASGLLDRFHGMSEHDYEFSEQQRVVWAASKEITEHRVVHVICLWLERYWNTKLDHEALEIFQSYFLGYPDCRPGSEMMKLYRRLDRVASGRASRSKWLKHKYYKIASENDFSTPEDTNFHFPLLPDKTMPSRLCLFMNETGVQEFACQITIQSSNLFRKIAPEDLVRSWVFGNDDGRATKLDFVNWEKSLAWWTTISILSESSLEGRVQLIEFWIEVAMACLKHYDFHSTIAIRTGYCRFTISRLRRTALALSIKHKGYHRVLYRVFEERGEYARIIGALTLKTRPMVLMLDPLLNGVLQVSRSNLSSTVTEGRINFCHVRPICYAIQALEQASMPYRFKSNAACQQWLTQKLEWATDFKNTKLGDETEEFQMSHALEPTDPELVKIHHSHAMLWDLVATPGGYEDVPSISSSDVDAILNIQTP